MNLTSEQKQTYFENRLDGQRLSASGRDVSARCPFHSDKQASLSVNVDKGVWKCHGPCNAGGGIVEFEMRFSNCDAATARANIAEVCGLPARSLFPGQKPEAAYSYADEDGKLLFEKLRFPGKRFRQRTRSSNGEWIYKLDGVRKVLYNLAQLIIANLVFICEGEKDCDNLTGAIGKVIEAKYPKSRFAATTNFDGAGKWRPEYSPYFTGKRVFIFPDNDDGGRKHAQQVAESISPYAREIRVVSLPGVPEKGDVSDYLSANGAGAAETLLDLCLRAPIWKLPIDKLLVQAPQFLATVSSEIEWLVDGVIQRGSNGFICSLPKVGKSWLAVDLALSLALGLPWVGFEVRRPVKTALITREDNPSLTKWRMRHLLAGKNRTIAELENLLYVNSREQSPEFRLDKSSLFVPMIADLKLVQPEFVILDVFNVLHGADENDNTQMRAVLEEISRLQREVGCAIGLSHHLNKQTEGTLTQRLRGSSAIAGWAEWLIGIEPIAGESHNRKMQFELKAATAPEPLTYLVRTDDLIGSSRIERVEWTPPDKPAKRHRAEEFVQ